ncbi:MAG TPA: TonB-dependent receptor [Spirochaetia bacterium]|nr:TonB-dependent receptor [Spirochaetia bacterium]
MRKLCGLLLFAMVCSGGWADGKTATQEVVVTATRIESPALTAPGYVTTISSSQIMQSAAPNLAEVIQQIGGIQVNGYGAEGSLKTASIQGATSSQVLVLLNGVRLNSSQDGLVDLSQIPLDSIERIEIVRGGDSALYGTNAIGGVINIITKEPSKDSGTLRILNGSYLPRNASSVTPSGVVEAAPANPLALVDTQKLDASIEKMIGRIGLRAGVSGERAANQYTWLDTVGINELRTMSNAGFLKASGSVAISAPVGKGKIDLSGEGGTSTEHVPPMITSYLYPSNATQRDSYASAMLRLRSPAILDAPIRTDLKTYYRYRSINYSDPLALPAFADTQQRNTIGADLTQSTSPSDNLSLTWTGLLNYDAVKSTEIGNRTRTNLAGGAVVSYLIGDLVTLTPAIRYDWINDFGGHLSYSLAGVMPITGEQAVKLVLASSYRAPAMNDLYWPTDPYSAGNPNLLSETSYSGQAGYSLRSGNVQGDAYLFSRYTLNQITWALDPTDNLYRPQNLGVTLDSGLDAHLTVDLFHSLSITGSYTFLYSFVLSDQFGKHSLADNLRVPYSPLHSLKAEAKYTLGPNTFGANLQIHGQEYSDSENSASGRIEGSTELGVSYSLRMGPRIVLQVAGKNLLNRAYVTQPGYVTPPLSLWVGVTTSY